MLAEKNAPQYNLPLENGNAPATALTDSIVADVKKRFLEIDPAWREYEYGYVPEYVSLDSLFNRERMIYLPELSLYMMPVCRLHTCDAMVYDAATGKFMGEIRMPVAVNPHGLFAGQTHYDCDYGLELSIYKLLRRWIWRPYSISISSIRPAYNFDYFKLKDLGSDEYIFWGSDSTLYLSYRNVFGNHEMQYWKIKMDLSHPEE